MAILFTAPLCFKTVAGGIWVSAGNRMVIRKTVVAQVTIMMVGATVVAAQVSISAIVIGAVLVVAVFAPLGTYYSLVCWRLSASSEMEASTAGRPAVDETQGDMLRKIPVASAWNTHRESPLPSEGTMGPRTMPKFTIVTDAGNGPEVPDEPLEFPDKKTATDDAQIALAEMARDKLPNGKRADFAVKVEDETGSPIYAAAMQFAAKTEEDMVREDEEADAAAQEIADALAKGPRE